MDALALHNSPDTINSRTAAIHDAMLRECRRLREPNFTAIGPDDLARLFTLYDRQFFNASLGLKVINSADGPLTFRLSSNMTRSGGMTIRTRIPRPDGSRAKFYEIAIASRMLFRTFGDIDRRVVVCGFPCATRLQALQRIMEHEIIHLVELLMFETSSCAGGRFQTMARRIFGHTQWTHDLVTPREHAAVRHGIHVGTEVRFHFEGVRHLGVVNRINRRATVLVEAGDGVRYTNGKRYKKFYVPLASLQVAP